MADPQKNKQTVIAYYNMAFNDRKPAEAAMKYGGPHYIQHNPPSPRWVRGVRRVRGGLRPAVPPDEP
jgi:predicted SnoaL-like aldol condensation-catalyzing enzyme